jgi:hypothetical protein
MIFMIPWNTVHVSRIGGLSTFIIIAIASLCLSNVPKIPVTTEITSCFTLRCAPECIGSVFHKVLEKQTNPDISLQLPLSRKDLAGMYFFETLVRLHRESEGGCRSFTSTLIRLMP